MGLTVTVLGCSGTYAAAGSACTGYLVQSETTNVWLDAGPGTLANLQRHITLDDLDAVVLTHQHPDHWLEVPVLYNALKYYVPRDPLRLYGTAGTKEQAHFLIGGELEPTLVWDVVADCERRTIGDQSWRFSRTEHYVETLAVRVDSASRVFAFSADTGPGWSMKSLGPGIDLAFIESTFLRGGDEIGHLTAPEAGAMAADASVGSLILTHLAPGADAAAHAAAARTTFGGPVTVAALNERYEV